MKTLSLRTGVSWVAVATALMWAVPESEAQEQEAGATSQPTVADYAPVPITVYFAPRYYTPRYYTPRYYTPRYYTPRYYTPRYYTPWAAYYGPARAYYNYWLPPPYYGDPFMSYYGRDYVRPVYPYRWRAWRNWRRLQVAVPPPY